MAKTTYESVEEMLGAVPVEPPRDADGMEVGYFAHWDYLVQTHMKEKSRDGWLIVPGSVHVASLPWGRNDTRPYIVLQVWRKKPTEKGLG